MPLDSIIRSAVKIADKISDPVQETFTHVVWMGADGFGASYPPLVVPGVKAIFVSKTVMVETTSGKTTQQRATLTFLKQMPDYAVVGRTNPIDGNDQFVFADGSVGRPVPGVTGLRKGTSFILEVVLQ
jgi:hypothetical protein